MIFYYFNITPGDAVLKFSVNSTDSEARLHLFLSCFIVCSGDAVLKFSVNSTAPEARLHLFVSEDWRDAAGDTDCRRRLAKARELGQ